MESECEGHLGISLEFLTEVAQESKVIKQLMEVSKVNLQEELHNKSRVLLASNSEVGETQDPELLQEVHIALVLITRRIRRTWNSDELGMME